MVHLSASGTVCDQWGSPIQGAKVYLRELALLRTGMGKLPDNHSDVLAQSTTDAHGRFAFKRFRAERLPLTFRAPWQLVIVARGYGLAWHGLGTREEQDIAVAMSPGVPIQGRLIDRQGKPAAGVTLLVEQIDDQLEPEKRYKFIAENAVDLYESRLRPQAITDADGRFVLVDMPREHCIEFNANHPRFAQKWFTCATIERGEIDRFNSSSTSDFTSVNPDARLLASGFTATLEQSRYVRGQVVFGDTGQPARGARVTLGIRGTLTDDRGRYSIERLDAKRHHLYVQPPENSDYLDQGKEIAIDATASGASQDFALVRGAVISGQLRDKETKAPIRLGGLRVQFIEGNPESEGSYFSHGQALTKSDGSFRLAVSPNKGKLTTFDWLPGFISGELASSRARPESERIEIKAGQSLSNQVLLFDRGANVAGIVLDENGNPAPGVQFFGFGEQPPSGADGSFKLSGLDRDRKLEGLVIDHQRGVGAKLSIEPPGDIPVKLVVTLKRMQGVEGVVIDENSKPIANARVTLGPSLNYLGGADYRQCPFKTSTRTDALGNYKLMGLPVDVRYRGVAVVRNYASESIIVQLERGMHPKLPDIVLHSKNLELAGLVVDQAGKPLKDVEVWIQTRNRALPRMPESVRTSESGSFRFVGLPAGEFRVAATIWKQSANPVAAGQRPVMTPVVRKEFRFESGSTNLRIELDVPKDEKP